MIMRRLSSVSSVERFQMPNIAPSELVPLAEKQLNLTHLDEFFTRDNVLRDLRGKTYEVRLWKPHRRIAPFKHALPYFQEKGYEGNVEAFIAWLIKRNPKRGLFVTAPGLDWRTDPVRAGSIQAPFLSMDRQFRDLNQTLGGLEFRRGATFVAFREIES